MKKINVNEIFVSINGEVNSYYQGSLTVFLRLQGCSLGCDYCDTKYAQSNEPNKLYDVEDLYNKIESYGIKRVTITGGEPLEQRLIFMLAQKLCNKGYQVSIETNGSIKIPPFYINYQPICWIVDYKIHKENHMILNNYKLLFNKDWVKIVIDKNNDHFYEAVNLKYLLKNKYKCRANFAIGLTCDDYGWLVDKIIQYKQDDMVLNTQIHKMIWPDGFEGSKKS